MLHYMMMFKVFHFVSLFLTSLYGVKIASQLFSVLVVDQVSSI